MVSTWPPRTTNSPRAGSGPAAGAACACAPFGRRAECGCEAAGKLEDAAAMKRAVAEHADDP